jgi:hypothetical protein
MTARVSSKDASGRVQTPVTAISSGYADEQYVPDVTVSWLYRPHAVLAICAVLSFFGYLAYNSNPETATTTQNARTAFVAIAAFIMILGMLVFPSGPFIRPHPILWRVVFAVAVIYEIVLIAILFQSKSGARQMMTFFDSSLGVPLNERNYAADCALTWTNVSGNIDIFVVSHFVGWALKALIIRDTAMLWTLSIMWEFIEMLFTHMLPNFAECWWDQWILDVLICNGLGIYFGQILCRKLEMMDYHWKGVHEYPTYSAKARRVLMQFAAPESWVKVRWPKADSLKRFFGIHALIVAISLEELNAFFLKQLLWLPPSNYLNLVRLLFWFLFSLPCLRQFYLYMADPTVQSIGRQAFLCVVIIATEVLIIIKMGAGEFKEPMAFQNKVLGWVLGLAYLLYCVRGVYKIVTRHPDAASHSELSAKYHARVASADAVAVAHIEQQQQAAAVSETSDEPAAPRRAGRSRAAAAATAPVTAAEPDSESDEEGEVAIAKPVRRAAAAGRSRSRSTVRAQSPARARAGRSSGAKAPAPGGRQAKSPARKSTSRARARKNE